MKINWLILLNVALVQPFMLHSAETAGIDATTTIAKVPFTQEQITALAQQAIASCMIPQTSRYKDTLQSKLAALLTFRSQTQRESLRDKSAGFIIKQQHLDRGYIQADQYDNTNASSSANKQSWLSFFKNKLLTELVDEQAEIAWAYEIASLLVQYWPTHTAYQSRKKREEIKNLMNSAVNDATIDAQASTIAKMPLTQNQIATLAQQAIVSYITPQTRKYEATLQKRLIALLTFRSQLQSESLRDKSAEFIIKQQSLNLGYVHADQYTGTTASSSASNKRWSQLFRNKLLTKSADEQAEITWTYETASLLIQYWPIYNTYMARKQRECIARKREQPYDSVEEIDELLRKNRRHNDSPVHFVPVADEQISVSQTPATAFDLLMHSSHDVLDTAFFPDADGNSFYFGPSTSTEDYFQIREPNEN